jgi:hypothetical protein
LVDGGVAFVARPVISHRLWSFLRPTHQPGRRRNVSFHLDTYSRAEAVRARDEADAALKRARFILERCRFLLAAGPGASARPPEVRKH